MPACSNRLGCGGGDDGLVTVRLWGHRDCKVGFFIRTRFPFLVWSAFLAMTCTDNFVPVPKCVSRGIVFLLTD